MSFYWFKPEEVPTAEADMSALIRSQLPPHKEVWVVLGYPHSSFLGVFDSQATAERWRIKYQMVPYTRAPQLEPVVRAEDIV
jgi:DNA integrity scanning protein DisA with diadenylate cyclase activity